MEMKYRICDIRDLQQHIMQDYFEYEIVQLDFPDWKKKLKEYVDEKYKDTKLKLKYENLWLKFRNHGIDSISVRDMDITSITAIHFSEESPFGEILHDKNNICLKRAFFALVGDRNYEAHLNGNETVDELFQFGMKSISNIESFINAFLKVFSVDESIDSHSLEIERIKEKIISTYKELIRYDIIFDFYIKQIENEIDISRRNLAYHDFKLNIFKIKNETPEYRMDLLYKFMMLAEEKNIAPASLDIADYLYIKKNYPEAAIRYKKNINELNDNQIINLANIYLNEWDEEKHSEEEISQLISRYKCKNSKIEMVDIDGIRKYVIKHINNSKQNEDKSIKRSMKATNKTKGLKTKAERLLAEE